MQRVRTLLLTVRLVQVHLSDDQVRLPTALLATASGRGAATAAQVAQTEVEQISIRVRTSERSIDLRAAASASAIRRRARPFCATGYVLNPQNFRNLIVGDAHQYEWNNKEKEDGANLVDLQCFVGPGGFAVAKVEHVVVFGDVRWHHMQIQRFGQHGDKGCEPN